MAEVIQEALEAKAKEKKCKVSIDLSKIRGLFEVCCQIFYVNV